MHMLLNFAMLQDAANQTLTSLNQVQTTAQPDAAAGEISLSIWELTLKGGWIMGVLAIMSIIAIYIFVERYLAILQASKEDRNFMNNIRDFIHHGRVDAAIALCKAQSSPISRMIEKGLQRLGKPLNDINAAIENVGKLEVSRLEKNIAGLATIAGAAPMLGFLGTVIGMITAFYDMSMAGNNVDIVVLSSGIYQAMVTTVGGLIVGIVAYVCYNVLVARIEKLVFILEARATDFMDILQEPAA
ncbi:MAG: MotA/TolQ/ExbB proton channel family protein [Bacteroidales bacterium]|nr:MotA/TolQ/ExbB proton channel family protein [Bacteroidales bacterium]NPV37517.1 MotA/TolQ/ExbB proton channel family protein [Bacteroidales bacterium]